MGDNWSNIMQSRQARIAFGLIVAVVCGRYAIDAFMGLLNPNEMYIEAMGTTGYYVTMAGQAIVCLWVCFVFLRQALKAYREKDDQGGR